MDVIHEVDWLFVFLVLLPLCAYCTLAGFLVGRGWGRPKVEEALPLPPVPDHVPDNWASPVWLGGTK